MLAISRTPTSDLAVLGTEFDAIINKVKTSGVTEREFQKARNQIETQHANSFNNVLDKAQALAQAETFFGDPNRVNTEIERYMKVTQADVQRVAKKYLTNENRIVLRYLVPAHE